MPEISENTKLTVDIKTIVMVVGGVISLVTMYFALQKDIELAKQLPEPTISREEFNLKDALIRETIINTQTKVEENSKKLDDIDNKLYEIIRKQ
jgi:hypothetical protein